MTISPEATEAAQRIAIEYDIVVDSLNHIEQRIQLAIDKAVAEKCKPLVEALQIWKDFPHSMPAHCHSCEAHSHLAIRATEEALANHTKPEGKKSENSFNILTRSSNSVFMVGSRCL